MSQTEAPAEEEENPALVDQDAQDDALIAAALDPTADFDFTRALEPGEKADDAVDFEDIGDDDDDLAEDEDEGKSPQDLATQQNRDDDPFSMLDDFGENGDLDNLPGDALQSGNIDDLFGDVPSSPLGEHAVKAENGLDVMGDFRTEEPFGGVLDSLEAGAPPAGPSGADKSHGHTSRPAPPGESVSAELLQQMELFAQSRNSIMTRSPARSPIMDLDFPPAPPENNEELLASLWPKFKPNTVPKFMDLIPPKKARYVGKTPLKVPKPVQPTKISIEIAPDLEKSFKYSAGSNKRTFDSAEQPGYIVIRDPRSAQASDEEMDIESDYENEPVGGITWQDFQVVCGDWDTPSPVGSVTPEPRASSVTDYDDDLFNDIDDRMREMGRPSSKVCPRASFLVLLTDICLAAKAWTHQFQYPRCSAFCFSFFGWSRASNAQDRQKGYS